jgi:hypothetical protein
MFTAATTTPSRSRTGAAIEHSPSSNSWSTMAYPCRRTLRSSARSSVGEVSVWAVRGRNSVRASRTSISSSARSARITRPTEVRWAGKRVPTVIAAAMMRRVGTRAT